MIYFKMIENPTVVEARNQYKYQPVIKETFRTKLANYFKCDSESVKKFIFGFFPILSWLPKYSVKSDLPGDVVGGVTTAIVRIPQSLAYALLAGVDPINGMYTAFFAPLMYSFLGTSSHISVGTFAVISLMLGSALEKFLSVNPYVPSHNITGLVSVTDATNAFTSTVENTLEKDPEEAAYKMAIVGSITLLVGILQIVLGICNMGFVALFLSDPLISGFTTGAAVYVFSAQVKYFFGIKLARQTAPFALAKMYIELFSRLDETKLAEVIISVLTIVMLYPIKLINIKYKKQLRNVPIPMELIIVVIATIVSFNIDFVALYDVEIVGTIPSGIPQPSFPKVTYWPSVISDAFSIAIVSFAITVSIGKLFAKKHGYKISPNQELFALGMSQLSCAFFQAHACSGSLARSSVKESSGTRTQFSDVVSCVVMLLVLLFIGPMLEPLPVACLSSIIMVNVRTLFHQFLRLPYFWKTCKYDFTIWIISFVATVLLGVDFGLLVGVVSLLASIVLRKYNSSTTVSGRLGESPLYGDVDRYGMASEIDGVKIIRFPESPFFGNKESLEAIGAEIVRAVKRRGDGVRVTSRPKQSDRLSEQSRGLLEDESSESDSGVDERNLVKYSEDGNKNSTDDFVISVNSNTGAVHYESKTRSSSNVQLASSSSRSTISQITGSSGVLVHSGHYFNTVVFDCAGWTFIDTMGIDVLQQMCLEFCSVDLKVFFADLPSKVFDSLSDAELFGDVYHAVAYPTLLGALKAANATQAPPAGSSHSIDQVHSVTD